MVATSSFKNSKTFCIMPCDQLTQTINEQYPISSTSHFVEWSALIYILLPILIAMYNIKQLYSYSCNCIKYQTAKGNIFQTGTYSYVLSILLMIYSFGLFIGNGCSNLGKYSMMISSYCIYFIVCVISYTRFICQNRIKHFHHAISTTNKQKHIKIIAKLLFSAKHHWILTFISLLCGYSVFITFNSFTQQTHIIHSIFYGFLSISIVFSEFLFRIRLSMANKHSTTKKYTIHHHIIITKTKNIRFISAIICIIIAAIAFWFEKILMHTLNINFLSKYTQFGYV
eukprot:102905_1